MMNVLSYGMASSGMDSRASYCMMSYVCMKNKVRMMEATRTDMHEVTP
ncbi:hypothetical protein [Sphingobium sp. Z007]|nr:hypothetical protein [Sphingobium sp. Z007]